MAAPILPLGEGILRRQRRRVRSFGLDEETRKKIAKRVCQQYRDDLEARGPETEARLNRYAKYRQWKGPDLGWPWPGSSDQAIPDMMEASIRMQDTIHNAVMSARPIVVSRALQKDMVSKQKAVDALHDTQLFIEQDGERVVEQAAESFVNDPSMTFHTTWVTEHREVTDLRTFPAIPDDKLPALYFGEIMEQSFPPQEWEHLSKNEGWDWEVRHREKDDDRDVSFYTKTDGTVEMLVESEPIVFDGPCVFVKSYDDVICPPGAANLDIPSPSNPGGAAHVILRDYPTVDEIVRLSTGQNSFYDIVSKDERERFPTATRARDRQERKDQEDTLEGVREDHNPDKLQGTLTRLVSYDTYDIDGDGKTEDVVFWVILETETLLRVRYLTEVFPGSRPERPLASASFLPVGSRRAGISLLETIEGLHDFMKATVDQMVDNGTLVNLPWFTYRASSSIKPETLRPGPGDGIPLNDPRNDIVVQQFRNDGQAFWLNLATMIRQQMERLTLQGDLQAGRVPGGASSALRTLGGIQTLLSQGEARPERILRRFFMALRRMTRQMHRLNRYYLPPEKKFRAAPSILQPDEDPYFTVATSDVDIDLEFDFHANVLNSSKQALQAGLQAIMAAYVSPLALQLGISTPETVYRLLRDLGEAFGQNVDQYLNKPSPTADQPKLDASTAMLALSRGVFPDGQPLEGATGHLEKLQEIIEDDLFGQFPSQYIPLLRTYMQRMAQQAQQEQQLMAQAVAASQGDMMMQHRGPGRPPMGPVSPPQTPMLESGELADESLPTA